MDSKWLLEGTIPQSRGIATSKGKRTSLGSFKHLQAKHTGTRGPHEPSTKTKFSRSAAPSAASASVRGQSKIPQHGRASQKSVGADASDSRGPHRLHKHRKLTCHGVVAAVPVVDKSSWIAKLGRALPLPCKAAAAAQVWPSHTRHALACQISAKRTLAHKRPMHAAFWHPANKMR